MIAGTPKFDGITLGEFTASFLGPPGATHLEAKSAFVSTSTGHTHGWTKTTSWSPETLAKLAELKEAMERDVAKVHFGGDAVGPSRADQAVPVAGLGEFLDTTKDAPQM